MYEVAIYVWPENSLQIVIGIIKREGILASVYLRDRNVFPSITIHCETRSLYSPQRFRELTLLLLFINLCLYELVLWWIDCLKTKVFLFFRIKQLTVLFLIYWVSLPTLCTKRFIPWFSSNFLIAAHFHEDSLHNTLSVPIMNQIP